MPAWGWLDATILGVFGLLIGSFLNVVIHRLPAMMYRDWLRESVNNLLPPDEAAGENDSLWKRVFGSKTPPPAGLPAAATAAAQALETLPAYNLLRPRSCCPACGAGIRWYQNIPVLSWLALRGRCARCQARISVRYPLVELLTGAFFGLCGLHFGLNAIGLAWAALAALLITQFFIDLDTQLLPDDLNYLILWGGLVAAALGWTGISLTSAVWGAVAGYLSLWTVYQVHHALTGKQGFGFGDFKLLAGLGAWFGGHSLVALILMSSLVGSVLGGALLLVGRLAHRDIPIPFGPFLAGAGLLVLALGPGTLEAWLPVAFPFSQPLR